MNFKELSLFNEALFAKQTWRLLHNKNSLFYIEFLNRNFSQIIQSWMQKKGVEALMLGKAF